MAMTASGFTVIANNVLIWPTISSRFDEFTLGVWGGLICATGEYGGEVPARPPVPSS